jgi:hypothetical protein
MLRNYQYCRLEEKYEAEGVHVSRSVLSEASGAVGDLLRPIWLVLGERTVASDVLWTDDTPTVVLESFAGKRALGRFWIHRDLEDRHYYTFSESRSAKELRRVLGSYRGWMHADGYKGYGQLFVPDGATHVGCWAHARRHFVRALKTDKKLAQEAIDQIAALYLIDRGLADLEPEARSRERKRRMKGPLKRLRSWLAVAEARVLPKSPLGRAVRYTLGQWHALTRFPLDGRLRLDNNLAENAIRPIAVGRNYVDCTVMLTFNGSSRCRAVARARRDPHNHSPSRNARRRSDGRYRLLRRPVGASTRARARSLRARSASR